MFKLFLTFLFCDKLNRSGSFRSFIRCISLKFFSVIVNTPFQTEMLDQLLALSHSRQHSSPHIKAKPNLLFFKSILLQKAKQQ